MFPHGGLVRRGSKKPVSLAALSCFAAAVCIRHSSPDNAPSSENCWLGSGCDHGIRYSNLLLTREQRQKQKKTQFHSALCHSRGSSVSDAVTVAFAAPAPDAAAREPELAALAAATNAVRASTCCCRLATTASSDAGVVVVAVVDVAAVSPCDAAGAATAVTPAPCIPAEVLARGCGCSANESGSRDGGGRTNSTARRDNERRSSEAGAARCCFDPAAAVAAAAAVRLANATGAPGAAPAMVAAPTLAPASAPPPRGSIEEPDRRLREDEEERSPCSSR